MQLYAQQAGVGTRPRREPERRAQRRPRSSGSRRPAGLPPRRRTARLPGSAAVLDAPRRAEAGQVDLHVRRQRLSRALRRSCRLGGGSRGALVVAKPESQLRSRSLHAHLASSRSRSGSGSRRGRRSSLYFSRRITRPARGARDGADEVAAGHYDVELPGPPAAARSSSSPRGSARWRRGSRSRRSCRATSSCRSPTSCARR